MAEERRVVGVLLTVILVCGTSCLVASDEGGNLECEDLPIEDCAFSVSSSGARCVLEKSAENELQCQTSFIMAERRIEWIETSECIKACGVDRMTLGMSTDSLSDMPFLTNLCSHQCNHNCHNIFDLYASLAAGDGLDLPRICSSQAIRSQRMKVDLPYPTTVARLASQLEVLQQSILPAPAPASSALESPEEAAPPSLADDDYYHSDQQAGFVEASPPAESPEPSFEHPAPHSYDEFYYPLPVPPPSGEPVYDGNYLDYDHQDSDFDYMEPWY